MTLVLCFHRVIPDASVSEFWPWIERGSAITVSRFRSILSHIGSTHRWIDETEFTERLVHGRGSSDLACWVTFDDGYRDALEVAAPVLSEIGVSPTLFISTRILQEGFRLPVDRWYSTLMAARAWFESEAAAGRGDAGALIFNTAAARMALLVGPSKRQFIRARKQQQDALLEALIVELGCPNLPCRCDERAIQYLDARGLESLINLGWKIGPHGASHELLHDMSPDDLEAELVESHAALSKLRHKSSWAAWPDGAWTRTAASLMQRIYGPLGYQGCLSVDPRIVGKRENLWAIPRIIPCRENGWACGMQ